MLDINDDAKRVGGRMEIRAGIVRRRRWTDGEKGRIVAEAVAPGAVIAAVARRHDLAPQHLSNWIRAAKDGRLALPAADEVAFVPVVACGRTGSASAVSREDAPAIEITMGSVVVRVANGADRRTVEAVLRVLGGR
jgi:transposase